MYRKTLQLTFEFIFNKIFVNREIVEASAAPATSTSSEASMEVAEGDEAATNGTVRRRPNDTLPMEVT